MIGRRRKLVIIQSILLIFGLFIIYNTYYKKENNLENKIIPKSVKEKIKKQELKTDNKGDVFYDITYTGLDLSGNRYILKSEEAILDGAKPEIIYMKIVHATFYFKDNTTLNVWADTGVYNNKTLDMQFRKNVEAKYLESDLFADKADFINSKSYLSVYENVKIFDKRGNLVADKLLFDITKQKLDITSFNENKVNANIKLNEKKF